MNTGWKSNRPCILLFGPTAVGKTELITKYFSRNYEVVSADALQVYRGLDIGTAKPSGSERDRIPHHLIDIRDPSEGFSVGDFVQEADKKVTEILERGRLPLVTGGTAFYLIRFLHGLPETPPSDPMIRRSLENRLEEEGVEALYEELRFKDPQSYRRIHRNDLYRILRALEVYYATGRPLSSFRVPSTVRSNLHPLVLGLYRERGELYRRIDSRVELMCERGLFDEIRRLLAQGHSEEEPGMKGIGYREFFQMRRLGEWTPSRVKEEIKKNSRRYAKRQLTFFRRIDQAAWFLPEQGEEMKKRVDRFLASI